MVSIFSFIIRIPRNTFIYKLKQYLTKCNVAYISTNSTALKSADTYGMKVTKNEKEEKINTCNTFLRAIILFQ